MKRSLVTLGLTLCLMIAWPLTLQTDQPRGMKKVVIRDKSGNEIGLYESSYALVIGVSDYTSGWPRLPEVKNDVQAVKEVLESHGFRVIVEGNPAHRGDLDRAFDDFINQYGHNPDDRLLFYFAGHGHTIKLAYGGEMGYIVPADAPNPNRDLNGFLADAVDMQMVEVYAKRIQAKHALFLFDSCFSGSIFALSRAVPENISHKTAKPVRQFITSGSAEEQVPDKSIFCQQFVEALDGEADVDKDGYVTGTELGEFLEKTVINYSKGCQHPQYGKIRDPLLDKGDFVLPLPGQSWTSPIPLPPSESSFSIDDLVHKADLEAVRAAWASKLKEMEKSFDEATDFQKRDISADLKVTAWERFLDAFTEDNPYSEEDDKMKQEASRQIAHWKNQPDRPSVQKTKIGKDGAPMVLIPAGEFQMGSNDGYDDEKPVHKVYLDAFYMDVYEVTNAQYKKFMDATGHKTPACWNDPEYNAPDQPVVSVSWDDAKAYCDWAGKRLPTEAEWEKAARGGLMGKTFPWGDNPTHDDANYLYTGGKDRWEYTTAPVGSFAPNGYGLYDMAGNVSEWGADLYGKDYYTVSPMRNPTGPGWGKSYLRVLRGGSYGDGPFDLRVACRYCYTHRMFPDHGHHSVGFRCVVQD